MIESLTLEQISQEQKTGRSGIAFLFCVLLLASILILQHANNGYVHWDEVVHSNFAKNSFIYTKTFSAQNLFPGELNPPLYFYVRAVFLVLLGDTYFSNKLVSILMALGTIVLIFCLAKQLYNTHVAILSVVFATLSTIFIHYGHLATIDSMFLFFVCLTMWSYIREKPLLLPVALFLCLMTKYYGFVLPMIFFLCTTQKIKENPLQDKRVRLSCIVSLFAFSIILILLMQTDFVQLDSAERYHNLLGRRVHWNSEVGVFYPGWLYFFGILYLGHGLFIFLLGVLGVVSTLWSLIKGKDNKLLPIWFCTFFLLMTLDPNKSPRYVLPVLPPFVILAAAFFLWLYRRKSILFRFLCTIILGIGLLSSLCSVVRHVNYETGFPMYEIDDIEIQWRNKDGNSIFREVSAYLNEKTGEGDVINIDNIIYSKELRAKPYLYCYLELKEDAKYTIFSRWHTMFLKPKVLSQINNSYILEKTFAKGYVEIYRRK